MHWILVLATALAVVYQVTCDIRTVDARYIGKKSRVNKTEISLQADGPQIGPMYNGAFPPLKSQPAGNTAGPSQPVSGIVPQQTSGALSPTNALPATADPLIRTVRASNTFGTLLTKSLMADNQNTVISPLSLAVGFGMLFVGANAETKKELANVLQYQSEGLDTESVLRAFYDITSLVAEKSSGFQLATARAIFVQKDFSVNDAFKNAMVNSFGAAVRSVDFATDPARATNAINTWSKKATKGIFPALVDGQLSPQTMLVLLNAVYFKGFWEKPFSIRATFNSSFFNDGTERKKLPMMYQRSKYRIYESKEWDAKFVEIPYEGKETAMIIALPNNFTDIGGLLGRIDVDKLLGFLPIFEEAEIDLYLPKFDVSMTYALKNYLEKMGMKSVFQRGMADLSGISLTQNLTLSDVIHKARVLVDERGTEASAITALPLVPYTSFPVFNANHPFLFFMVHKPTKAVLFSGKIIRL